MPPTPPLDPADFIRDDAQLTDYLITIIRTEDPVSLDQALAVAIRVRAKLRAQNPNSAGRGG